MPEISLFIENRKAALPVGGKGDMAGIHTCIDTAGAGLGEYADILRHTDLVLYDVKHWNPDAYRSLTGLPMDDTLAFVEAVRASGTPMWVRHVVVPGLTDSRAHLAKLRDYAHTLPIVERVELLPYHLLGKNKFAVLGVPYTLESVPAMDKALCKQLQTEFFRDFGG